VPKRILKNLKVQSFQILLSSNSFLNFQTYFIKSAYFYCMGSFAKQETKSVLCEKRFILSILERDWLIALLCGKRKNQSGSRV
jgi:hypothetical protein